MKSLTKVLLKIFGIILLYWFISGLISLVAMLPQYKLVAGGNKLALIFTIANAITILISAAIGYLLLFKTELVMRILQIEEENAAIDEKSIFPVGCKLIGIYIFISEIGSFFRTIILFLNTVQNKLKSHFPSEMQGAVYKETSFIDVITILIPIILSLLLVFRAKSLTKFIKKFER
jgi:hypothetical protein